MNKNPKKTKKIIIRKDLLKLPLKKLIIFSFVINALVMILIFLLKRFLPPEVPLYYGLTRSESQVVEFFKLTYPSFMSIGITIINVLISFLFEDEFLKKLLIISGFFISVLTSITTLKIILLVGSF